VVNEDIGMSISIGLDSKILEPGTTYSLRVDKLARDTVAVAVRSEAFAKHKWRPLKTAPGSSAEGCIPIAKGAHEGTYQLLVKEQNEEGIPTVSMQTFEVAARLVPALKVNALQAPGKAIGERLRSPLRSRHWDKPA
jgi:hypothetical protein